MNFVEYVVISLNQLESRGRTSIKHRHAKRARVIFFFFVIAFVELFTVMI